MLVALLPLLVVVVLLLAFAGDGWIEKRMRLGRNGRSVVLDALPRAAGRRASGAGWSGSARASCRCCWPCCAGG